MKVRKGIKGRGTVKGERKGKVKESEKVTDGAREKQTEDGE